MGLFSSSYKYKAYAGSSTLIPAEDREHTVKSLLLQAAISGQSSMAEAVKMGLQTDMNRRALKMAKFAGKPDGYLYGFPTVSNQGSYYLPLEVLQPILEAEIGTTIEASSEYRFSSPTNFPYLWTENGINDAYDSWFTGDPPSAPWTYYPDEVEIPVTNPDTGTYYLADNKDYDVVASGGTTTITYHYTDNLGNPQTWTSPGFPVTIPTSGQWIMYRYKVTGGTRFEYFFYEIGSGDIPAIESNVKKAEFAGEFLPIAILMHDNVWFDELVPQNIELEEGLDRLLKYLSLDPTDIKDDFIDSIENPDPETDPKDLPKLEDVWDFFVHFSMPLRTTDRAAREYLWRFYQDLASRSVTDFDDYNNWVTTRVGEQPRTLFSVEEGEEYTGYIARYAWSYISTTEFSGEFTPPGWDRPLKTRECWSEEYQLGDPDYNVGLDLVHGPGNYNVATAQREEEEHTYTIVVRQNKLSEGDGLPTYTAVLMMGPSMEYQINTSDVPTGVGDSGYVDYRYRFVECELFPEDPEQDSEFRWPVKIGILKEMSAMRREPALQEALTATVFLVDKIKVKWYQKSFFKWLIIIIVIIIIIITYQYQLLGTVSTMASTALATGATATAIALAALYVTMVFALGFLISFAGSLIGGTWGQIFVILASIYLAGGTNFFGNIGTSWGNMVSNFGWGTATSFLQAIGPIISIGRVIIENRALAKLESDMRDFTKTAREKDEELQDAWDQLGGQTSWLDPLDLVGAFKAHYVEHADSYYQRTLNANPGVMSYDVINQFADLALTLPENGNPGEFINNIFIEMEKQRGAV